MGFCCLIWMLFACYHCIACTSFISHSLLPELTDFCTARNFCHTNATKVYNPEKFQSCCQACSCDVDCLLVGNCCPDMAIPDEDSLPPVTPCLRSDTFLNVARLNATSPFRFTTPFKFITTCPANDGSFNGNVDGNTTVDTKEVNSENRGDVDINLCEEPSTLEDYIPVSTVDGYKLYRNRHCARCHGEQRQLVNWNLQIRSCHGLLDHVFTDFDDQAKYILENCMFTVQPTKYQYVQGTICELVGGLRHECNITGEWDVYDAAIEADCLAETPRINDDVVIYNAYTYANPACYKCNMKVADAAARVDKCRTPDVGASKGGNKAMTTLLDMNVMNAAQVMDQSWGKRCPGSGQAYDKHTGKCRQVLCGIGMVPIQGSCQLIGPFSDISVSLFFAISQEATTDWLNNDRWDDNWRSNDASRFIDTFSTTFDDGSFNDLLNCVVDRCVRYLYSSEANNDTAARWYMKNEIATTETCPLHKLLESLAAIVDTPLTMEMNTQNDTETMNISMTLYVDLYVYNPQLYRHRDTQAYRPGSLFDLTLTRDALEMCPRFRLNEAELAANGLSIATIAALKRARVGLRVQPIVADNSDPLEDGGIGQLGRTDSSATDVNFTICMSRYEAIMQSYAHCPTYNNYVWGVMFGLTVLMAW